MTLAITLNIVLSLIVLTAIIGSLTWAIMTSRQPRSIAPANEKRARQRSTDRRWGAPSRLQPHA